ncbi:MAG TPA: hypothetical protein VLX59_04270, partial [Acidimicrobiales bacterium]|nr:hypothetical protein [Acidimicrobiales bacterium]
MTDVEAVLTAAEESSGRGADRSQPWVSALRRLTASADGQGDLTEAGAAAFAAKLRDLVEERLRAEAMLAEHTDITTRPMTVRFAVAGMGRSGTTLL